MDLHRKGGLSLLGILVLYGGFILPFLVHRQLLLFESFPLPKTRIFSEDNALVLRHSPAAASEPHMDWVQMERSGSVSMVRTDPTVVITATGTYTLFLPALSRPGLELHGRVTAHGEPVSGVSISLYICCFPISPHFDSFVVQRAVTNQEGLYNFANAPTLAIEEGRFYYAQYSNSERDPGRLGWWRTSRISAYEAGDPVSLGTFDIAGVALLEPEVGVATSPPVTFRWQSRSVSPSETYALAIVYAPWTCFRSQFAQVESYTLEPDTQPNLCSSWLGPDYAWTVHIDGPNGGHGQAVESRFIHIDFPGQ